MARRPVRQPHRDHRDVDLGAALSALAALAVGPITLYLTFFLIGATMSGLRLGYANIILEMSPDHFRATCVALLGTLVAPLALSPLLVGILLMWVPVSFALAVDAVAMIGAVVVSFLVRDPRHGAEGMCIT